MFDLAFENPDWIHATWALPVLALVFLGLEFKNAKRGSSFLSETMKIRLARTTSFPLRVYSHCLMVLAVACFVLAMMRPQYGFMEKKVPHVGAQIMICLDVSKSMLAEDASPNRLERAKSELEVLLNYLKDDQVGLIAFAGSASVLCPMTTDFGYLKMLLRESSMTSVGLGGTHLEQPIRRAMAGFSDNSDMSKVIILITDGEDNGSKPIDAAKAAAERGIRIITIGFGHEAGTKIQITDPRTGISSYVKDANDQPVISKLDIDLLKKIASNSNGAFIPARVGSLDVESIHRDHIKPLMRASGETTQIVKNEAFQWPLAAGITMVVLALILSNSLAFSRLPMVHWIVKNSSARVVPFLIVASITGASWAQESGSSSDDNKDESKELGADFSSRTIDDLVPEDPVECYNMSVDILNSDTTFAEKLLEAARKKAGDNADLRFRSSYNLGWVKIHQANRVLKDEPKEALKNLTAAADWFRESVRLRPKNDSSRENLDIVLRRIAELNDSINKSDPLSFEKQLDQLIQRQLEGLQTCRQILEKTERIENNDFYNDDLQKSFRLASVDQRLLNSDLNDTSKRASQLVEEYKNQQQTPAQPNAPNKNDPNDQQRQLRMAQVQSSLVYLDRAAQRLGQARSQLRLKNANRATLRSALGLDELKRARDQLRNPAEILRQIIADCELLHRQTNALVAGKNSFVAFLGNQTHLPKWLTHEYLLQFQTTQLERTGELSKVLSQILQNQGPNSSNSESVELKPIQEANDSIAAAVNELVESNKHLADNNSRRAQPGQVGAIEHLREAYEQFADLTGLIELTYHAQVKLNQELKAAKNLSGDVLHQVADKFVSTIDKNLSRLDRINYFIQKELAEPDPSNSESATSQSPQANQTTDDGKKARFNEAAKYNNLVIEQSNSLKEHLVSIRDEKESEPDWNKIFEEGQQIEDNLALLRRLFFTIVEHLRETVNRQDQLNTDSETTLRKYEKQSSEASEPNSPSDDPKNQTSKKDDPAKNNDPTKDVESKSDNDQLIAPLASRQSELAQISNAISDSLQKMSQQPTQPGSPQDPEATKKYLDASKLVGEGKSLMDEAINELTQETVQQETVRANQQTALEKLAEALNLLQPPKDNNDESQNQQKQAEQQESQSGEAGDANQSLLQRIRDREMARRKNKKKNSHHPRVEKDW